MFNQNPIFKMKKLFFSLFLSVASIVAFAQNPIDGNWKGTRETPNGTFEVNYTFKAEGNKLTGTWKTQFGETTLEEGIIDVNHTLVYYAHRDEVHKHGCYYNVNTPKTKASTRQVPMLDFVKEAFIMEREYQGCRSGQL